MKNKFAIAFDGFIQDYRLYDTLAEIKPIWEKDISNRFLYDYDCSVYEVDEHKKFVRIVSYEELQRVQIMSDIHVEWLWMMLGFVVGVGCSWLVSDLVYPSKDYRKNDKE